MGWWALRGFEIPKAIWKRSFSFIIVCLLHNKINIGRPYDRAKLGTDLSAELGARQREET